MASNAVARAGDKIRHPDGSIGTIVREKNNNGEPVNPEDVIVEGKVIAVDGDTCSLDETKIIATTQTVFANGKKVLRMKDKCGQGGEIVEASEKVFAGD